MRSFKLVLLQMCDSISAVATNLDLDPALIDEAVAVGGHRTQKEAVTEALREYIDRRRRKRITTVFGAVDYDREYNPKKQRRRR